MSDIIIFGTGQIAELAFWYFQNDSSHKVVAFCVDGKFLKDKYFKKIPVVDFNNLTNLYPPNKFKLFIPISYIGLNSYRKNHYQDAKNKGYSFESYISSKLTLFNSIIGDNCFILENNTIQPFSNIGNNVIMWSGNHLGHHSEIGDHCFISSHVVISGNVKIGESCFFGVNSTIYDNLSIGSNCIISAGSVVHKNLPDNSIVKPIENEIKTLNSEKIKKIL